MKKLFILLTILSLGIVSCNTLDPLEEKLDALSDDFDLEINYSLTESDYATLVDRILYLDSTDETNASFIESNLYFTDDVPSSTYIPMLLDVLYPNLNGASADITFNYNGEASSELTALAGMDTYTISADDFSAINSTIGYLDYFYPPYIPDAYIPTILKLNYKYEGSSDTVAVAYNYSDNEAQVNFTEQINATFSESFSDGDLGLFTAYSVIGNQEWGYIATNNGAASMNGYDDDYYNNEDWLVSPVIDLTDVTNTYLQFSHNVRYYANGCLKLLITSNITNAPTECNWSEYVISNPNTEVDEYIESDLYNLSAYDGLKIRVAFKYTSSTSDAPEWSISDVEVGNYGYQVIGGGNTYLVQDYYAFDSTESKWTLIEDIHYVDASDYAALNLTATSFSEDLPSQDYLPTLATSLYPTASTGDIKYMVFDYDGTTLTDALTKTDNGWSSSYAYINQITEPYRCTDNAWKFDPSVILAMEDDDYQIIIDYVNSVPEYAELNTSTYSNSEYYFGASAYYNDFDVRTGNYYSGFESWQDAVVTALLEGFLPNKYPDATQYVSGVEVFYYITFNIYTGATASYTCTFGVSKDAPNPEFELIDGPTSVD